MAYCSRKTIKRESGNLDRQCRSSGLPVEEKWRKEDDIYIPHLEENSDTISTVCQIIAKNYRTKKKQYREGKIFPSAFTYLNTTTESNRYHQ